MLNILVVDDDPMLTKSVGRVLRRDGYSPESVHNCASAMGRIEESKFDLVLLDVHLPDGSGLVLLDELCRRGFEGSVVMMSGESEVKTAVEAVRLGARDFIEKPLTPQKIRSVVSGVAGKERNEDVETPQESSPSAASGIIGVSKAILSLREMVDRVAPSNARVLITGENGTGKELVVREIVMKSSRAQAAFEKMNCAAVPKDLVDSELFGHEKGAFTGAAHRRRGRFELAHKGTLFLDELGEMSLPMQAKLLRVLQEGSFERVGGEESQHVDVRVITATNCDLDEAIAQGSFRQDLYFRVNVIPIRIPPLRDRREDIEVLSVHFFSRLLGSIENNSVELSSSAIEALCEHDFPGNVRELQNIIERVTILRKADVIKGDDVRSALNISGSVEKKVSVYQPNTSYKTLMANAQRAVLLGALDAEGWNLSAAATTLGLERSHLSKKCKALGIVRPSSSAS